MLSISQDDFFRLTKFIYSNYGINLTKKKNLIEGRLYNTIIQSGLSSFKEYIDYAINNPDELEIVINKLTTNHTYFMREYVHFDIFKNVILPKLEKTKKNKVLSIWSAGCSTGEEPYTLSMILKDYFENKNGWDTRVLATDISQKALGIAKKGAYKKEALTKVPKLWLNKYFINNGDDFALAPLIKENVIFKTFNLMSPINFKLQFDVIFCRNVMIYFDQPTKNALVRRFYDATATGGYLLVGHSETLHKDENPYKQFDVAVYLKE